LNGKGYGGNICALRKGAMGRQRRGIVLSGYIPKVVPQGAEKTELKQEPGKRTRRRVVELVFSWLSPVQETAGTL